MFLSNIAVKKSRPSYTLSSPRGANVSRAMGLLVFIVTIGVGCASVTTNTSGQINERPYERNAHTVNSTSDDIVSANATGTNEMSNNNEAQEKGRAVPFYTALETALNRRKMKLADLCDVGDAVSRRVLEDYGAIFVANTSVLPPPVCMFANENDVADFQEKAQPSSAVVGGATIELQSAAMKDLLAARDEAHKLGLDITPRGGTEAATRTYADTSRLWNTRFFPALTHWNQLGRLSKEQVAHLRALPQSDQVREVLELEKNGIYFSRDFSKSILYSIAAPGTSQHISMLALDVDQFSDARVRRILARHGWFQTVKSDLPHFTYLGLEEKDLPGRGLRSLIVANQVFWIPNVGGV